MLPNSDILERACTPGRDVEREVLESVVALAVEIAREGREGRKIGTMFVVGDVPAVLGHSKELILDPLQGHPREKKCVTAHDMRETVKELAQLDGAFVVSGSGVVLSACRYLDTSSRDIKLPLGLGSRHMAAASITRQTRAMAVVVSESSVVRVFDDGGIVAEVIPEFWIMSQYESARERDGAIAATEAQEPPGT